MRLPTHTTLYVRNRTKGRTPWQPTRKPSARAGSRFPLQARARTICGAADRWTPCSGRGAWVALSATRDPRLLLVELPEPRDAVALASGAERKGLVAVAAVQSEPVSRSKFPVTGIFTGNSRPIEARPTKINWHSPSRNAPFGHASGQEHAFRTGNLTGGIRESQTPKQGISESGLSGRRRTPTRPRRELLRTTGVQCRRKVGHLGPHNACELLELRRR